MPGAGGFVAGTARLYVPLSLIAGAVVAAPTVLADSVAGRLVGVAAGTGLLALIAWTAWRRMTSTSRQKSQVRSFSMGEAQQFRVETGGQADVDADALLRRMRRTQALAQHWPALSCGGLAFGGAIGALTGSFLLTVTLAAAGFLLANAALALPVLAMMRQARRFPPSALPPD